MATINAAKKARTIADPAAAYLSMFPIWERNRAICSGERFVKEVDEFIDNVSFGNLLIPFSTTMSQRQYNLYKAEAELPGIVAQYARVLIGGLLRKEPVLELPEGVPEDAHDWIVSSFSQEGSPLISFLDTLLWEEIQTSRSWIYIDYPHVSEENRKKMTSDEFRELRPYPVLWRGEQVINWRTSTDAAGTRYLSKVLVRGFREREVEENEFHPEMVDTIWVHEVVDDRYRVRIFEKLSEADIKIIQGRAKVPQNDPLAYFRLIDTVVDFVSHGKPVRRIPAWPTNGSIELSDPILGPLVDKEIALYNKISRRNHLLYGAATYTPVVSSDMSQESFEDIVNAGLGSWIKVGENDSVNVLATPTEALKDMDRAIASAIEEMAKLGIRMLAPESSQSGVALELRNAAQTAQLGTLNARLSRQFSAIITYMLNRRYGTEFAPNDVKFNLSADFNPTPLGADWLRLATEWYQDGLIPRSVWMIILKQNDMIPSEYDDSEALKEINADDVINKNKDDDMDFSPMREG